MSMSLTQCPSPQAAHLQQLQQLQQWENLVQNHLQSKPPQMSSQKDLQNYSFRDFNNYVMNSALIAELCLFLLHQSPETSFGIITVHTSPDSPISNYSPLPENCSSSATDLSTPFSISSINKQQKSNNKNKEKKKSSHKNKSQKSVKEKDGMDDFFMLPNNLSDVSSNSNNNNNNNNNNSSSMNDISANVHNISDNINENNNSINNNIVINSNNNNSIEEKKHDPNTLTEAMFPSEQEKDCYDFCYRESQIFSKLSIPQQKAFIIEFYYCWNNCDYSECQIVNLLDQARLLPKLMQDEDELDS